jgi:hypothetical protein
MSAHTPPPITVLNFRKYEKNTLRAVFDLQLASGLVLRGCMLHQSHGRQWIGLPSKPYTGADSSQRWQPIVDFANAEKRRKFQALALEAVLSIYRDQAA